MYFRCRVAVVLLLSMVALGCTPQAQIEMDLELDSVPERGEHYRSLAIRFHLSLPDEQVFVVDITGGRSTEEGGSFDWDHLQVNSYFADIVYAPLPVTELDDGWEFGVAATYLASDSLNVDCLTCVASGATDQTIYGSVYRKKAEHDGTRIEFRDSMLAVSIPVSDARLYDITSITDVRVETIYLDEQLNSYDLLEVMPRTGVYGVSEYPDVPAYAVRDGKQFVMDYDDSASAELWFYSIEGDVSVASVLDIKSLMFYLDR